MILASQSPRRIELMREAGYDFRVVPADIDETPLEDEGPIELVGRLARDKALAVARGAAEPGELVVAADTVVAVGDEVLGKPADDADARRMLRDLSGGTHQVATGVCLAVAGCAAEPVSFVDVTDVTFYPLTDAEIDAYVASGEPLDKAGAYGIQGAGGRMLVRKIDGDFYTVVGLPIARVARAIAELDPNRAAR